MQQGRVQLDADWNEQGAISRYRTETEAVDVIGGCGAPIHAAGFEITTDGKTLFIGGGRYYVDGLLAENDAGQIAYEDQDKLDLPGADMAAVLTEMKEKGLSAALVYLDVWQRHVTVLDDRLLREVALGGPDTTTRIKTVWQVKALPHRRRRAAPSWPSCAKSRNSSRLSWPRSRRSQRQNPGRGGRHQAEAGSGRADLAGVQETPGAAAEGDRQAR